MRTAATESIYLGHLGNCSSECMETRQTEQTRVTTPKSQSLVIDYYLSLARGLPRGIHLRSQRWRPFSKDLVD